MGGKNINNKNINSKKVMEINKDEKSYNLSDVPENVVEIESQPYKKRDYFFYVTELKFFEVLKEIIGDNYYIFPKVRICDIVRNEDKRNYAQFNKIKSKHVDFLICTKNPISPKIVVELDGSSHNYQSRIERDKFVDEVFASSQIPIVHIKTKSFYNKEVLIRELQRAYKTKYVFVKKDEGSQSGSGCSLFLVLILLLFSSFVFYIA